MIKLEDIWQVDYHASKAVIEFIQIFTGECQNHMLDNIKKMTQEDLDKNVRLLDFLGKHTTPKKLAKEIYPIIELDQLAYIKRLSLECQIK